MPQKATLSHRLGGTKTVPLRMRLTEKLGIRHPLWMGNISDGGLAGAVSEAGGLGVIGGGYGMWPGLNGKRVISMNSLSTVAHRITI